MTDSEHILQIVSGIAIGVLIATVLALIGWVIIKFIFWIIDIFLDWITNPLRKRNRRRKKLGLPPIEPDITEKHWH